MLEASFQSEIREVSREFSKLHFDIEKLKKPEKIISTYHIAPDERILGYIKSSIPLLGLTTEGTIITDCALYIHPCHDDWAATNRFPFSEICRYAVYMKGPKSDVYLARAEQVNTILGCTLFGKSVGGMELTQFIRSLQAVLLKKYDWAREQKKRSIQQLFVAVRTSMKHGRISDNQLMMLDNFGLAGDDAFSAKLLRAEDLYRSCNFESYDSFVNALPYEEQRKIKVKQEEFSKDLRRDLSDPKGTFDSEYLTSAHQNLSGAKRSAPSEKAIFCYLCIRLDRNVEYRLEKEGLARCDRDGAQEVEDFLHCFRNCRMNEVYHAVRLGKKLDPAWYDWQDNLGLTALHYAILLKKEELVANLLDKREWFSQTPVIDSRAKDYIVLAKLMGLSNCDLILQKTYEPLVTLQRSQKAMKRQLWLRERQLDYQQAVIRSAKQTIHQARYVPPDEKPDIDFAEYEEKYERCLDQMHETKERIRALKESIPEIEAEIEEVTAASMAQAADMAHELSTSTDPFLHYLCRYYSDSSLREHVLKDCSESSILYSCLGCEFAVPADILIDLPHRTAQINSSERKEKAPHVSEQGAQPQEVPIVLPFGDCWFSSAARQDMKALKEEYHRLAKQYHPDVCGDRRSQQIFQEILNERAEILERMAKE